MQVQGEVAGRLRRRAAGLGLFVTAAMGPAMALTVNNLTDTRAYANRRTLGVDAHEYTYIQPRAIILRLSGHF